MSAINQSATFAHQFGNVCPQEDVTNHPIFNDSEVEQLITEAMSFFYDAEAQYLMAQEELCNADSNPADLEFCPF